jgi:hypothetical protein
MGINEFFTCLQTDNQYQNTIYQSVIGEVDTKIASHIRMVFVPENRLLLQK